MRTSLLALVLAASPLRAEVVSGSVQPVHPLVMAVQSQPLLLDGIVAFSKAQAGEPEGVIKAAAALSAMASALPGERASLPPAQLTAVTALAAQPELIEPLRPLVGASAADYLWGVSRAFHRLAQDQPQSWGRALAQAKALEFSADESIEQLGAKLTRIFDEGAQAPSRPAVDEAAILAAVPDWQKEAAAKILKAQRDGALVELHEAGVEGIRPGRISNVHVEDGVLAFDKDGEPYGPFRSSSVRILETHADQAGLLAHASERQKPAVEALLKAQTEGLPVMIHEGGVEGETPGTVSNLRLEDGKIKFDLDGKPRDPFYDIFDVEFVKPIFDEEGILANVWPYYRDEAKTLLQAQKDGAKVSVREYRKKGERRGKVTRVRLEGSVLKFDLDGKTQRYNDGVSVKVLGR